MRKQYHKILIFLLFLGSYFSGKSQINYTFAALGGAYTANAAPTVLHGANVDDALSAATNIGFTFQYGCTNYTQFMATSNGVMFLGNTALGTNAFNDLTGSTDRPAIAPLWDDLKTGAAGNVNYKLTGVTPNRILTVEWKQMLWQYVATTQAISFQVKLYETTGQIDFVYSRNGSATANISAGAGCSIGISGIISGDYYSLDGTGAAPLASKLVETNTLNTKPATGQIYRWNPVTCVGTPAGHTAVATPSVICAGGSSVLTINGVVGCASSYQWQSSPNNVAWTNIVGATTDTYTVTPAVSTYYRCNVTCAGTGASASILVTVSPAPANDNCAGAVSLTPSASCVQTVGNDNCASQSQAGCLGTADDDVWYKFTAAFATQYINVSASASFDPVVELFSGPCGGLTSTWCNDASFPLGSPGQAVATGLTVGTTYYFRVYDYYTGYPATTTFTVCVTNPPTCPASLGTGVVNVAALPYVSNGRTTCGKVNDITSTNVTNICGSGSYYGGEDEVFIFTPATTGVVTITQSNTSGTVGFMLYTGCPFSGPCVANAQDSNPSRTICITLTAGTTYYLVVDSWPSPSCYGYDISISAPTAGIPAGTDCANPTIIASVPYSQTGLTTCCYGNDYTSTASCASVYMNGEDYVFKYTPAANISVDITLSNTLSWTGLFVTQGCPLPNTNPCVASNTSSTGNPSLCGVALTGGVTYYIIVDTDPSPNCTPFDIKIIQTGALATCNLAYTAATIPFSAADPLTTGTLITFSDDHFSDAYSPIGFNFCFDGIQYNQCIISSNGYLIFDPINCITNLPTGNATPGGYSPWTITGAIPNTTNAPRNAILGPWQDIDPGVAGNIRYATYGVTPNQRYVVSFENVAMFQCNAMLFNGQIKLYETSNNIEVHLATKVTCATWNGGQAILGLHNYNGTIAVVPGGHNAPTNWTATNKAWQFTTGCGTCAVILPIELLSFTGKKNGEKTNAITWVTSSEKNVSQFALERSDDGISFATVATITAKNAIDGASYSWADNVPEKNKNYYYRLATLDFNGDIKKSGIIVIERSNYVFAPFNLYPNPVSSSITLEAEVNAAGQVNVSVLDIFGNNVTTRIADLVNGFNVIQIPVDNCPGGMYYIKITSADGQNKLLFIQKIVKE